ncbi:hypothetical protein [Gordonia tangerina]|uniref:Uncharacterized protein n=1 Tax=Gordonia tangerina TaxID=2911060 RepID=A0ABS9DLB9_9ACTN|nr:hypothetical protein [Gordonia tangerina]MCF3939947.1 hypothetical protein [Gordonia tangerina]
MTDKTALTKLREPFTGNQISTLPKPYKKDSPKGQCRECGGYHGLPAVHLEYVGHAALTDRLLNADPEWSWEPLAYGPDGLPAFDRNGGLWIKLTVAGVTRLGYGDAPGKNGGNAVKEAIGDALRNAGMRFGAALDLWHKGDLHDAAEERGETTEPSALQVALSDLAAAVNDAGMSTKDFADWAISAKGPGLNIRECTDVKKLDELTRRVEHEGSSILGAPDHDAAQATLTDAIGAEEQQ